MTSIGIAPFKEKQKVVCIETDKDAMRNSSYKEKIVKGNKYVVKVCDYDNFLHEWYVRVVGLRTEWAATSFSLIKKKSLL